jgi:hypothetical protein
VLAIFAASTFDGQTAVAHQTAEGTVEPPTVGAEVLARLGIQRPETSDLTQLSLDVAQQVEASGLPGAPATAQQPNVGGLLNNLSNKAAQSATLISMLNSSPSTNFRDVMITADADSR